MAKYKSFETNKRKIEKTFERTNNNESRISNEVKKINKSYTSQIYFKGFQGGDIFSGLNVTPISDDVFVSIDLINFPEWAINMMKPYFYYTFPSVFSVEESDDNLVSKFNSGDITLSEVKLNTLVFFSDNTKWWFVKQDDLYTFNIKFDTNFQYVVSKSEVSFSLAQVQRFATLGINFNNQRNYQPIQSGK